MPAWWRTPVTVLQAHDIFQVRRGCLEDFARFHRDQAVTHSRPDAHALSRAQAHSLPFCLVVLSPLQVQYAGEQMNRFIFDAVELVAQGLPGFDVENFANVMLAFCPHEFPTPRLRNFAACKQRSSRHPYLQYNSTVQTRSQRKMSTSKGRSLSSNCVGFPPSAR